MERVFNATPSLLYRRERASVSRAQEVSPPEPVWTGEKKTIFLALTGIRISNLQVLASLYAD
jgi:hypothetical protein